MGIINMFIILLIALIGLAQATAPGYTTYKGGVKFRYVGTRVKLANSRFHTFYERSYRWTWSWPFGRVKLQKQRSSGGSVYRCLRKYYNLTGALRTVTVAFTNSRTARCPIGIRKFNRGLY